MNGIVDSASRAVVNAMGADTWQRTQVVIVALWREACPDQADAVSAELERSRTRTLTARRSKDHATEQAVVSEWRLRLHALAERDPELLTRLKHLLAEEPAPAAPASDRPVEPPVSLKARASGHGRIYQSGHDMNITER
jgi:hypothetical protein